MMTPPQSTMREDTMTLSLKSKSGVPVISCVAERNKRAGPRAWAGLALLSLPTVMLGLDLTLLHLTLPALALDLSPTSTQALWIMDAYGFFIAGFLITMGTLGDRIGRRRLLMIGSIAFAMASVVAAFSTSANMLIAARAALGVAGATLMPSTLALISNLFVDPRQRALGIGIWATMWGVGSALGPVVGGLMLEWFWWGAAFLLVVPVVALLVLLGPFVLPEYRSPRAERLDLLSVLLSLAAALPFVYGLKQVAKEGLVSSAVMATIVGVLFAWLFVRRQRRLTDPLLDLSLFSDRAFSVALAVLLFALVAVGGTMLLVAQYLQLVAGYSPSDAGLWMGLAALAMIIGGIGAPLVARAIRPGFVVAGALALSAAGYLLLSQVTDATSGVLMAVASLALAYLGNGTIAALGTDLVVGAAPAEKAGSASAMTEMVQDLGISFGIALLGSIAGAVYQRTITPLLSGELTAATREAVADSLWAASSVAAHLSPEQVAQAQAAFVSGVRGAALFSAVSVAALAVVSAVALRHLRSSGVGDGR
ncbi:MAG: MFS transporter [Pseudomonas stutzeri]|jgi:MFS transporter, DHA2 family, multidrug resistance protein|nr:MFS transporter [Stutzerimonas stutzeri]MTI89818.1 MFS transporter [Stutzerimonas stutzeri]OCX55297.1 MFS transporter [Stutzerimonas stutzeri]